LGRRKGKCATEEGGGWFDTDSENMCIGAADRGRRFQVEDGSQVTGPN